MQFNGVTFKNQRVRLDGGEFVDCVFDSVVLEYGGGAISLSGCKFTGAIRWSLDGDFGRGLAAFGQLYNDKQALGLRTVVEAMFPKRVPHKAPASVLRKAA